MFHLVSGTYGWSICTSQRLNFQTLLIFMVLNILNTLLNSYWIMEWSFLSNSFFLTVWIQFQTAQFIFEKYRLLLTQLTYKSTQVSSWSVCTSSVQCAPRYSAFRASNSNYPPKRTIKSKLHIYSASYCGHKFMPPNVLSHISPGWFHAFQNPPVM